MSDDGRRAPPFLQDLLVPSRARRQQPPPPTARGRRAGPVGQGEGPHDPELLARLQAATPSQVGVGRTGTRYKTRKYLDVRAAHAIAKDAVEAELEEAMAGDLGCLEVRSRCEGRQQYLLDPNSGRRLADESRILLEARGDRGTDVQIILADGLAAPAAELNGPVLLAVLTERLRARGLRVGRPILARLARVGLQDDVGVLLGCRATAICLGERPGLGTGDSLSIYVAIGPKLDQDNAEKNCISNVRPLGLSPEAAAEAAADLLARGLELGRGGLALC